MKTFSIIPFFLLFLVSAHLSAQKNYKGAQKYPQPKIETLPDTTEYIYDQGLDSVLESKLDSKIDALFKKHDIAGITTTILIPEKGIWHTNRGYISKPENIPVDSSSVFYWASVGKLITSTIIHQLVLEGRLSFDDKLSTWFPDIKNAKKITIEHLLTHTNGLFSFNADSTLHNSKKYHSPKQLLEIAKTHENLFKPGEYWYYTNTGYLLLALIIEKIESKTFKQVVTDRIAAPLHLKTLKVAPKETPPNLALSHLKDSVVREDYSGPLGAGNIISNSQDMAGFYSALVTGKIIPIENVHAMMKNLYPMFNPGQYYGRGIMLYNFQELNNTDTTWIGHSGGTENYKALVLYDTKSKIIMAISINENIPVEAVAGRLLELVKE